MVIARKQHCGRLQLGVVVVAELGMCAFVASSVGSGPML